MADNKLIQKPTGKANLKGAAAPKADEPRVWGRKSEPREDVEIPEILTRDEWKAAGYRVFADLRKNTNGNFYVTVVAPGGIAGSAYFSKAIQSILKDNEFDAGDSIAPAVNLVGLHIKKDEDGVITDLYVGALPNGSREEL